MTRRSEARAESVRVGGRTLSRADVPGIDAATGLEGIRSVPGGAYARPVWALDIAPALKYTAARYAAFVEVVAAGGGMRGIDPAAVRVDGSAAYGAREVRILRLIDLVSQARAAVLQCPGLVVTRRRADDQRRELPAIVIVHGVAVHGLTIAEMLRLARWPRYGETQALVRSILVTGLEVIADAWGFGPVEGPASTAVELFLTPESERARELWRSIDAWVQE